MKQADTDYNIHFCTANPDLGKQMLENQNTRRIDTRTLAVAPLFVEPANGDFRLKSTSPALKTRLCAVGRAEGCINRKYAYG